MSLTALAEVLTLDEVAAYLRVSPDVVVRQVTRGDLPGRKIETDWRFLKSAIDHWLSTRTSRTVLLQQAGAFADDSSLAALRTTIYVDRGRPETETGL